MLLWEVKDKCKFETGHKGSEYSLLKIMDENKWLSGFSFAFTSHIVVHGFLPSVWIKFESHIHILTIQLFIFQEASAPTLWHSNTG